MHNFKLKMYNKDNIIFKESEAANMLYFIKTGEIEISKLKSNFLENDSSVQIKKLEDSPLRRNKAIKENRVKIILCVAGSYFGQEEII